MSGAPGRPGRGRRAGLGELLGFSCGGDAARDIGGAIRRTALGCLVLTLAQGVILGSLGPVLAGRLDSPFLALAKSVGVEGAFQRVESVVAALWVTADVTMGGPAGLRPAGYGVGSRAEVAGGVDRAGRGASGLPSRRCSCPGGRWRPWSAWPCGPTCGLDCFCPFCWRYG